MSKVSWTLIFTLLFLGACDYDVPLTTEHNIPIDQTILGSWEMVSWNKRKVTGLSILEFSNTEYTVHYFEDDGDLYFRAYPIHIGGVSAVQLELLGDEDGPVDKDGKDRYLVASYNMVDGILQITTLNTDIVSGELSNSGALSEAFIANKDNPELFNDPGFFKRLEG